MDRERTGIRERRIAGPVKLVLIWLCKREGRPWTPPESAAADLDMILLATCTGDYPLPATACLVQHQLGATKAAACDLSAACCGFVYALSMADAYIKTGMRHVLVVGSEVMSAVTDWTDRNTCILFGDGAGAAVVSASDGDRGILSTHLRSDGNLCELITVPGGGSRTPPCEKVIAERLQFIKMKGNETFKVAVRTLEEIARETMEANGLQVKDLDLYVPHQANVRILKAVVERLGLPIEKVMLNLDRYGNTSAASIPIALDEAVRAGGSRRIARHAGRIRSRLDLGVGSDQMVGRLSCHGP